MKKITFALLMLLPILSFAQDQYAGAVEAAEDGDSHLGIFGLFSIIAVVFIIYLVTDEKRRKEEHKQRQKLQKSDTYHLTNRIYDDRSDY